MLPVRPQSAGLLVVDQPAFTLVGGVLIKVGIVQLTVAKPAGFVAQLAFPQPAALVEVVRRDSRVQIAGQVQVERQFQFFQTGVTAQREAGIEETRGPTIINRETIIGDVENRDIHHFQTGVPGTANALLLIEINMAGGDTPIVLARFTPGDGGFIQFDGAFRTGCHTGCSTAHMACG